MKYQQQVSVSGSWAKASEIVSGTKAKIVSETKPIPSSFKDKNGNPKNQDVAKVLFQGKNEPVNVSLNRATINGLISAFGDDSVNWQNQVLTVETEKLKVSGKSVMALYLIPAGYRKVDDENGYTTIVKDGVVPTVMASEPVEEKSDEGANGADSFDNW